jgi:hypothetical protein
MSDSAIIPTMSRAGFWRRALSYLIDFICLTLLLQFLGIIAYGLTGGRIQSNAGVFVTISCKGLEGSHPKTFERTVPIITSQMELTDAPSPGKSVCESSIFGFPQASYVIETKISKTPTRVTHNYDYNFFSGKNKLTIDSSYLVIKNTTVDVTGHETSDIDLAAALSLGFFLWRIVVEGRGKRTPGRRMMRIRLMPRDGSAPTVTSIGKRYLYQQAPFILLDIIYFILAALAINVAGGLVDEKSIFNLLPITTILLIPSAALELWYVIDVVKRRDTFYDRASGTCVIDDPS